MILCYSGRGKEKENMYTRIKENPLMVIVVSVCVGMIGMALIVYSLMPSMMLTTHTSKYATVDETSQKIRESIEKQGWTCPKIRNLTKTMAKHGVKTEKEYQIVEMCKAEYALDVLDTDPEILTLMPCALGVYKDVDGLVKITGMNAGLMGKMFGGNIARVMGGSVAADELEIIARVIK